MPIVSISLPDRLLEKIDEYAMRYGYTGRSELIREAIREFLESKHWILEEKKPLKGILIVLTDHEQGHRVDEKVISIIHEYQSIISSFYHQILEDKWCLNIAVVESPWTSIRDMLGKLRKTRGVVKTWFIPLLVD